MLDLDTAVDWNELVITFQVSPRTKPGEDESGMLSVSCNSIVMLPCPELPANSLGGCSDGEDCLQLKQIGKPDLCGQQLLLGRGVPG